MPLFFGFRSLAWNPETSLPSSGLIYTYVYLLYSTCVFFSGACPVFSGISLSLKLCSIYTFDLQFTLVRVCLSKPSGLLLPQVGSYWDWLLHVFGGGGRSFSPPHRVLSGLFGFVWPRFRSSFESLIHQGKQGGGRRPSIHLFLVRGCAFSFLLLSVLSELWPITIATSYIVNLLIRIFLGTKCFSIFYTTCVSWLLFRPCSGLPHVPLSFWNQSPFYRVHLHLRLSIIYLRFQVLIPSFRGISVSEIRFSLYIYLDLLLLANYTKHCP